MPADMRWPTAATTPARSRGGSAIGRSRARRSTRPWHPTGSRISGGIEVHAWAARILVGNRHKPNGAAGPSLWTGHTPRHARRVRRVRDQLEPLRQLEGIGLRRKAARTIIGEWPFVSY